MTTSKMFGAGTYAALAGADLTGKLFYFAKMGTDGRIVLCDSSSPPLGIITEEAILNAPVSLQTAGNGKVVCGSAITAGDEIQSDANGAATGFGSGALNYGAGVALNSGNPGEIIEFKFK